MRDAYLFMRELQCPNIESDMAKQVDKVSSLCDSLRPWLTLIATVLQAKVLPSIPL